MATVENIKIGLINKIRNIQDKEFLLSLDNLISSDVEHNEVFKLTIEQNKMLEISEADIKSGQLISQEAMDKRNLQWLNEL